MSYIDCFKHELLGSLNGLPIYHLLESVKFQDHGHREVDCDGSSLILGGGSGEHPALVVQGLDSIVAEYLLHDVHMCEVNGHERRQKLTTIARERLEDFAFSTDKPLLFVGWTMNDFADFRERTRSPLHFTPLKDGDDPERWIRLSLGEFVYFSVPELCPRRLEMQALAGVEDVSVWTVGYWMRNVQCPPPGYMPRLSFGDRGFFGWNFVRLKS
jgi:hypothetical protein